MGPLFLKHSPPNKLQLGGGGDVLDATVVRWVEKAARCDDAGGYLLALRPAALVMLCGQEAGRFKSGDRCAAKVTSTDPTRKKVTVGLTP